MKKNHFLLLALILFSGLSCTKKYVSPADDQTDGCVIVRIDDLNPKAKVLYTYDAQSRWIKSTSTGYQTNGDSSIYTFDIQYNSASKLTTVAQTVGSGIVETTVYNIKNNLATDAVETITQPIGTFTDTTTANMTFEHDSNGFVTKETQTSTVVGISTTTIYTYTYENGNLKTSDIVTTSGSGASAFTQEQMSSFTYDKAKPTSLAETSGDYNFLLTAPNKNYTLSQTLILKQNGTIINNYTVNYANTYDSGGKLIKSVSSSTGTINENLISTFSYKCGN